MSAVMDYLMKPHQILCLIFLFLLSVNFYSKIISIFLRIKSMQVDRNTKENPLYMWCFYN